jgi:hypothetical protein
MYTVATVHVHANTLLAKFTSLKKRKKKKESKDPHMFLFAITGAAGSDADKSTQAQYTKFSELIPNAHTAGLDDKQRAFSFGCDDLVCKHPFNGYVASNFVYFIKGNWPYTGLASTMSIQAAEIEVWQIPLMTDKSDKSPITDTTVEPTCSLLATATATAHNSSVMKLCDDALALRAAVNDLNTGWQVWLHTKLQHLDTQLNEIEQEEKALSKEREFMAYHFPTDGASTTYSAASDSSTTATSRNNKANTEQLKGVYNGIVHMVLHGDKICTLQQTFKQFSDSKLAHQYGSGRWNTAAAADLNSEGYLVKEYDHYCFRKLINVMRLRALMRSPVCELSIDKKEKCPSQAPANKKGALAWMLAHFMITKEDFYDKFASADADKAGSADGGSSKKRKR